MRLTPTQQQTIKHTTAEVFGAEAKVSLFGSRTDDTPKDFAEHKLPKDQVNDWQST